MCGLRLASTRNGAFMSLDPVLCADGCGRPADRERPYGMDRDGDEIVELVCRELESLEVT